MNEYLKLNSRKAGTMSSFSLDHLVYSLVPGKINQRIYERLLKEGVYANSWVVLADLAELTKLHPGDREFTLTCLERLRSLKLIMKVCKTSRGWFFLVPALKDFVSNPREERTEGNKLRLTNLKRLGCRV